VTDAVQKVCEAYKCKPVEGMLSHQLEQFEIDGEKTIIQNPSDSQKKEHEKYKFVTYEVYAMNVLVSTGEGVVSSLAMEISKCLSVVSVCLDILYSVMRTHVVASDMIHVSTSY
jgi:methionine aminopeptidase